MEFRNSIHFTDESFGHDPAWVVEFCETVLARGLNVELWAQIRLDDLVRLRPHFDLMKRAGFYGMMVGFESDRSRIPPSFRRSPHVSSSRSGAAGEPDHPVESGPTVRRSIRGPGPFHRIRRPRLDHDQMIRR